jgi:hypothetical protein
MELFDKCGRKRLRYDTVHHPPSRKFSPSVSNQACSCDVCCGSYLDKEYRNKVAAIEAKVCPPVRASHLAFLAAS